MDNCRWRQFWKGDWNTGYWENTGGSIICRLATSWTAPIGSRWDSPNCPCLPRIRRNHEACTLRWEAEGGEIRGGPMWNRRESRGSWSTFRPRWSRPPSAWPIRFATLTTCERSRGSREGKKKKRSRVARVRNQNWTLVGRWIIGCEKNSRALTIIEKKKKWS